MGIVVFFVFLHAGDWLIQEKYMSDEAVSRRRAAIYAEFSNYVSSQGISGRNSAAVARWTASHEYVMIFLFSTGREQQLYAGGELDTGAGNGYDPQIHGRLFPLRFADGLYQVAIGDNSQIRQRTIVRIGAFAAAAACFLLLFMWYTGRLTRRIIALSREAAAVTAGDFDREISAPGKDELSDLADSVDEMRCAVIERMGNEKRAWEANTELITAVSHDIRTPMTAIIGYLGLICSGTDEATRGQLASAAYVKALELKDLTDELFKYFLVYGKAELSLEMERMDGRLLLEQLLGELEFDLRDAGFAMQRTDFSGECSLMADPLFLKRVIDNLLSNIRKYADAEKPVEAVSELKDGQLRLCVSNKPAQLLSKKDSTKIGLRTCEKIIRAMGGSFRTENDGSRFTAEISLPAGPAA